MIIDNEGKMVYCPPDFLKRIYTREDFKNLVDDANQTGKLSEQLLTDFESKFRSRRVSLVVPEGPS
jgi:hypothetical protein